MNFGREVEKKSDRCGEIQTILGGLVVLKDNKQWDKGGFNYGNGLRIITVFGASNSALVLGMYILQDVRPYIIIKKPGSECCWSVL